MGVLKEQQLVLQAAKKKITDNVKKVATFVDAAAKQIASLEKVVKPMTVKSKVVPLEKLPSMADASDVALKDARSSLAKARGQIDGLGENNLDKAHKEQFLDFLSGEVKGLKIRMGRFEQRLNRATNLSSRFRASGAVRMTY